MKTIFSVLLLAAACTASAQVSTTNTFATDISGRVMLNKTPGYNIEGSYFFLPDYSRAILVFNSDKFYQDIPVKLNLLDNEVIYQADNGGEMVVSTPVHEIRFTGDKKALFRNGYPAINKLNANTYYQVLDSGKAVLLKHYLVTYWDDKPYNNPTPTRTYEQKQEFFISMGGKMYALDKGNANAVTDALADKKDQVAAFIKSNGLKFKKDEDYTAVIDYYNKL